MIREIVKRLQLASLNTVDGNWIDAYVQSIIDRFNKVQPRDLERRWTQTLFVSGFQPALLASGQGAIPWLTVCNRASESLAPDPPGYPTNKWRVKGTEVDGIVPDSVLAGQQEGNQLVLAWAGAFTRPVIINRVCIYLRTDGVNFVNNFQTGASPPPGSGANESSQDFGIEVSVDNPFSPENRSQGSSEIQKVKFWLDQAKFSPNTLPAVTDAQPNYTVGILNVPAFGRMIDIQCHVPIGQNSRARVSFVMPEYNTGDYSPGWGEDTWHKHIYSVTVGVLEPTI